MLLPECVTTGKPASLCHSSHRPSISRRLRSRDPVLASVLYPCATLDRAHGYALRNSRSSL